MSKEQNGYTVKEVKDTFNSERFDVRNYRTVIRMENKLYDIQMIAIDDENQRVYLDLGDEVE